MYIDTKKQHLEEIIDKIFQDTTINIQNKGTEISTGSIRLFIFRDISIHNNNLIFHELENENILIKEEHTSWWLRNGPSFAIAVGIVSFIGFFFKITNCFLICLDF